MVLTLLLRLIRVMSKKERERKREREREREGTFDYDEADFSKMLFSGSFASASAKKEEFSLSAKERIQY